MKITRRESDRHPYYIRLPRESKSPTDSSYKYYDIVRQGRVLWSASHRPGIIRSVEPFTISVMNRKGKVRILESKRDN